MDCIHFIIDGDESPNNTTINNKSSNQSRIATDIIIYFSASIIISLFSTMANFGLIIGLKKTNKKLTLSQKLYIYLSLTDGIVALIMPYYPSLEMLSITDCRTGGFGTTISMYGQVTSFGTFITISYLRNLAIRKPFYMIPKVTVYSTLVCWNLFAALMALRTFFTYKMSYSSQTLFYTHWLCVGLGTALFVIVASILNLWSKKILETRSGVYSSEIELQQQKRNKTAVKILNIILAIYAVCMLPLSIYLTILGAIMFDYKGKEDFLRSVYSIFSYFHLPIFPCSGLNALAYMLKDKKIRKFYKQSLC